MNVLDNLVTGHTRNIPENATIMFLRDGGQMRDGMDVVDVVRENAGYYRAFYKYNHARGCS
jgi:hypothetical protein